MSWTHPESTERKLRKSDALAIQLPSSSLKHNRNGRVMQMSVLLDDFEKANLLLDGENS